MTELTRVWPMPAATASTVSDIADWYVLDDRDAPWLRMNFISSADGAVTVGGLSGGLGTEPDHAVFDALRCIADVVIVGAGTVRAEGYGAMRVDAADERRRRGYQAQPSFAIVSRTLDFSPDDAIFQDAPVRPIIATCEAAGAERFDALAEVADVIVCGDDRVHGQLLREALVDRGLPHMHCEGGPHLFGDLVRDDAVDELCLTISPMLAGGAAGRILAGDDETPRDLALAHVIEADSTLLLRYTRDRAQ